MSDKKDPQTTDRKPLTLSLNTKKPGEEKVRQNFSHGRSKSVVVEVKKKRGVPTRPSSQGLSSSGRLSSDEIQSRLDALKRSQEDLSKSAVSFSTPLQTQKSLEEKEPTVSSDNLPKKENSTTLPDASISETAVAPLSDQKKPIREFKSANEAPAHNVKKNLEKVEERPTKEALKRQGGRIRVNQVTEEGVEQQRSRSFSAIKRAKDKERRKSAKREIQKVYREVQIPNHITVLELANRMTEKAVDIVRSLMNMGMMVTINEMIDADTAEIIVTEFGHTSIRTEDRNLAKELLSQQDSPEDMISRPPVVTIMGHVDHGKTSLLDALRQTDVVAKEAGGITQHIGAYQITMQNGKKISFIDTPGHKAFSEMRSRGANVTDIIVLVVAADDGIKEQTLEAISHAKAAGVPIIVAINKIDKPDVNPKKVREELLAHEVVLEEFGGDVMSVEVSAKKRLGLEKLEETILLQAEVLDLKANPNRSADGIVVEASLEKGRGAVATVLVQRGTLKPGDIFVAGAEVGKVRTLTDSYGLTLKKAGPGTPIEVMGFSGVPQAGDQFIVVDDEAKAREIGNICRRKMLDERSTSLANASSPLSRSADGHQVLNLIIKADVHGSSEALKGSFEKLNTDEVSVRIIHSGVGGVNESDMSLAKTSSALVFAFNVRATPQAKDIAQRDKIDIRYYSIIYEAIDDVRKMLSGLLAPDLKENFLGYAEIRKVFASSHSGKIAGCMITSGVVKRGCKVRLIRDNIVIHEGDLKSLRREKDEVKEAREGFECGIALASYQDIKEKDVIECFEVEEVAREL